MGRIRDTALDEREQRISDTDDVTTPTGGGNAASWPRQQQRRQRDLWFMLGVLALGVITVLALSMMGNGVGQRQASSSTGAATTRATAPAATSAPAAPTAAHTNGSGPVSVVNAQTQNYPIQPDNAGLMQGAVDTQGNIWFGEMSANKLARLNPKTGAATAWTPPNGRNGIMQAAIDKQGNIWFTESVANYIGRFDPATQQFTTYPLAVVNGTPITPENLQFDTAGMLWFTADTGARIGKLDPATGAITTWAIPSPPSGGRSYPFALAVTSNGQVWFGDLSGGAIGQLDPATGHVQFYALDDKQAAVFSMAADKQGRIWFTELEQGKLGMIDTNTRKVTEYSVPTTLGPASGLYDVVITANGDVWFPCTNVNALVRFTPTTSAFTFFSLPTPSSAPYGLALDSAGNLWFTADTSPTNYVGMLHP